MNQKIKNMQRTLTNQINAGNRINLEYIPELEKLHIIINGTHTVPYECTPAELGPVLTGIINAPQFIGGNPYKVNNIFVTWGPYR